MMNEKNLKIILGVISILTGLIYVMGVYGPTEAEVSTWGLLAMIMGGLMVYFGIDKGNKTTFISILIVILLSIIQIPAIILWFIFSGSSISDGTPPSYFVANWIYATPHIFIVLLGLLFILVSFKTKRNLIVQESNNK
ncbi:hypothetical protein [Bacillus sp. J33]|uniref:hypothetical protein n=1 Tax=Bacillus sp. J33 TaxID=935836 RepID=UPI0012F93620|nr:hypothetical protein [Bacillus sp. J33]